MFISSYIHSDFLCYILDQQKMIRFLTNFTCIGHTITRNRSLCGINIYKFGIVCLVTIILSIPLYRFGINVHKDYQRDDYKSKVFMSHLERNLIRSFLNESHTMLEYGSGYSTLYFSQFVGAYYSIEHNQKWYKTIRKVIHRSSSSSSKIKQYKLVRVDPGYKGWSGGFNEGTREQFDAYIRAVHSFGVTHFDRVLIDGRARKECALEIIPFLRNDSIIFIHDFTNRPSYWKVIENHYQKVLQTYKGQTLGIFKLR